MKPPIPQRRCVSDAARRARLTLAAGPVALGCGPAHAAGDAAGFAALWLPLLIIVLLAALAWWLVRSRVSLVQRDGPLRLVQILPVGPRERLLLVEIDGRRLLIGATPQHLTLLDRPPSEPDPNATD